MIKKKKANRRKKELIGGCLYIKGRRFEYQAISILKKMGFQTIFRSPRSRGVFDIFALKGNPSTKKIKEARYIQIKASRSPFHLRSIVPKEEREKIIKNKMVIILGKNTFYEIWIRRLNRKWEIYRLNWKSKEFECLPAVLSRSSRTFTKQKYAKSSQKKRA